MSEYRSVRVRIKSRRDDALSRIKPEPVKNWAARFYNPRLRAREEVLLPVRKEVTEKLKMLIYQLDREHE